MGAYVYKPNNIVVETGSSLIKHKEVHIFTPRRLALYEMFDGDKKRTMQFFKDKYHVEPREV